MHLEMDDALEANPVPGISNGRTVYFHRPIYTRLHDLVKDSKNVILDGFFSNSKELVSYIEPFLVSTTYFIKVIASIEKCNQREAGRRHRPTGTAAFSIL